MNLILLLSLSLVLSSSQASRKSEVVRYLDQIYDQAQELGRPLVNGEMNLLPEGVEGFANSVRCFYGEWLIELAIEISGCLGAFHVINSIGLCGIPFALQAVPSRHLVSHPGHMSLLLYKNAVNVIKCCGLE